MLSARYHKPAMMLSRKEIPTMTGNDADRSQEPMEIQDQVQDRIVLDSRLSEMERLPAWIDALALQYGIVAKVGFAIHLCLEEALSNVIRHSYANKGGHRVSVSFTQPQQQYFLFTIDDDAPHFNPLELPSPALIGQDITQIGGQGIRLLRGFSNSLEYEATPTGNRLRIGFSDAPSTTVKK
jgi:serine/threonine-protein kinase RsbW